MRGRAIPYSAAEMNWLEQHQTEPITEWHAGFVKTFARSDVEPKHLNALRKRKGWRTGRSGQFAPGQTPANKGKVCEAGKGGRHPNSQKTQFRKGERRGVAVRLYKPVGTERLAKDGYLERKIHDGLPLQSRWRAVHLIRWEAENGPVPKGSALKCLDGDRLNTDPANWECIPRGVLARLNGGRFKKTLAYDEAHPAVKPAVMAMAKLRHQASERRSNTDSHRQD